MTEEKVSTITVEQLWANGWEKGTDPVFPARKVLTEKKEDEDESEDEGDIELVVHRMYNVDMFALSLPDGTLVNINPASIEELNLFERLILSVDPPY